MPNLHHYSLQGRLLASDCLLPYLTPAAAAAPDLTLCLVSRADPPPALRTWYRSEMSSEDECPSTVIDETEPGDLIIRFVDGTTFLVGPDGRSIAVLSAPAEYMRDDLAAYALGPVLGVALHLQGAVLLHASAVMIRGRAVVFAGAPGSGKSTTAAILHRLGYGVLSDDLTEIGDAIPYAALPAPGMVRLWPDVVDSLYGPAAAVPGRAPSWPKKVIRVEIDPTAGPREIGAILFLDRDVRAAAARLERLTPAAGWQRLMADAYTARLPGAAMTRKIFEVTAGLADRVPMYLFTPPPMATSDGLGTFLERELDQRPRRGNSE